MVSWYDDDLWSRPYVTVGEQRQRAEREIQKLQKQGKTVAPIRLEGRKIASSFWGEAWCTNLERYSDYANRLPRGRSYIRNGAVVDLQITKGLVTALVSGTTLYKIKITIAPVTDPQWEAICRDCSGTIDSLVELLQGRLSKSVMERICRQGTGLFPAPKEIKLSCSCPDGVRMCKHVAAALYGVGARLDHEPEHIFVLRGVDHNELIAGVEESLPMPAAPTAGKVLADADVAALFGIDIGETVDFDQPAIAETIHGPAASKSKTKLATKAPAGDSSSKPKQQSSGAARPTKRQPRVLTPVAKRRRARL